MGYSGDGGNDHLADQEGNHQAEREEDDPDVFFEEGEFHPEGSSPYENKQAEALLKGFQRPGLK